METSNTGEVERLRIFGGKIAPVGGAGLQYHISKRGGIESLEPVEFSIGERLRCDILSKKRKRKLQNVTIKIDALEVQAIRKLATTKSIPYQTVIRHWLSEEIKKELNSLK